ncbi:glycosyltransferase family 90 protein [Armillaria fumosa]|nr:glycosyltransferase family 90 protein [Armillaria fumosa]
MTFRAFTEPATIEYVEPVYQSSGDLGGLGNLQYEGAGKKISDNLPMHEFLANGLLEVNPEGPHPIYQLIKFSERKRKAKLQRASRTLDEAVAEYECRYGRAPPRGFDKWWEYVEKNNVQLPDEYDQIHRDLEPYWGVNPVDLPRIVSEWEGHKDSFTLGKEEGQRVGLVNYTTRDPSSVDHVRSGAQMLSKLLEAVDEFYLPSVLFSIHMTTRNMLLIGNFGRKCSNTLAQELVDIDVDHPVFPIKDHGWISGCAPTSPAWKDPINFTFNVSWPSPPPNAPKIFVFNHRKAMDPCLHSRLLREHGQFLPWRKGPTPSRCMVPSFAYSQTLLHHDITIAHMVSWLGGLPNEEVIPWEKKTDDRLHWRGSTTGIPLVHDLERRFSHRIRMMDWVEGMDGNVTILAPPRSSEERVGKGESVQKARYGPAMLDMAFSDRPVQCDPDVCEELKKIYEFTKRRSQKEQGRYKYIFDVDGNAWSGRFKWLLSTQALIFKSTTYPEWFTDRLMPWVYYIPIQGDYSDLWDALVFFRGDLKGDNNHEDLARKIASAGRDWSRTFWRKEDMTAYNYRVFLEYARIMSTDRVAMSYNHWSQNRAEISCSEVSWEPVLKGDARRWEHTSGACKMSTELGDMLTQGKRDDCCAKAFMGNYQDVGTISEEIQSEDLVDVLRGRVKVSQVKPETAAFTRPTTVKYVKPSYYHSWGDLEVLRNSYYERAGKNVQHNVPMHEFLSNGLLEVNPELPHPIYQLIDFSERKWKAKLQRASKTLDEAVVEYERRYRRPPPRGFDKWWEYVEKNNVQLPDEYDQIYRDFELYWSIRPVDLNRIVREWEDHEDTFTLGKEEGHRVGLARYTIRDPATYGHIVSGVQMFSEMLEDVDEFLPPFRAVFHPHDNPEHSLFSIPSNALAVIGIQDIDYPIVPIKDYGWIFGCAPTSLAWKDPIDFTFNVSWPSPPPDTPKTFVFNHRKAMDPCLHPRLLREHGQFLPFRQGPFPVRRMVPAFAYSQTLLHHDITIAHRASWLGEISDEEAIPWEKKTDDRLHWRGSTTGTPLLKHIEWQFSHRIRMMDWVEKGMDGNVTILAPLTSSEERVGKGESVQKARYGPAMLDMAFSGGPVQCEPDVCEELKKRYEFTSWRSQKEQGRYKYIFDVDGNAWSGRFKWLLSTHALIFKSTIYPEWFTDRLMPWVHYIPIQGDYSDLWDALVFFRGDLKGDNNHEDLARKIASAGRDWSRTFWRKEDMTAYNFRLFLEYARIMSTDRAAMTYFHRKKEE